MKFCLLAVAALAWVGFAHADTIYKSVGPDGKVTYTTTPPSEGQKASIVRMDVAAPDASKDAPQLHNSKDKARLKAEEKAAEPARTPWQAVKDMFSKSDATTVVKKDPKTMEISKSGSAAPLSPTQELVKGAIETSATLQRPILFVGKACDGCDKAQKFLRDRNIQTRVLDVDTADGRRARNEMGGGTKLPLLIYIGRRVEGFDTDRYETMFGGNK